MATYLKRTSKLFDISLKSKGSIEMNLRDVICPICRGIFIEPVTLPCNHNLCLSCLNSIFKHNSLSCPLCRIRVGSWHRNATKTDTLINNELWKLIRTRFPNEIAARYNDNHTYINNNTEYAPNISAEEKIRREYEIQLKLVDKERKDNFENNNQLKNEIIIKKEDNNYNEFVKKNNNKTNKDIKYFECMKYDKKNENNKQILLFKNDKINNLIINNNNGDGNDVNDKNLNINSSRLITSGSKTMDNKIKNNKLNCCQQTILHHHHHHPLTLKHQSVTITKSSSSLLNYTSQPSCSNTKIYGMQSKEELHVPSDVLSNNKKSLGVEICVTMSCNDNKRIGSAESAGSHDSINQEIHHFKPIKPALRTLLTMTPDGKIIEPKLIKVIPVIRKITNIIPKPPSPSNIKQIFGCSWSAFRGKARQNSRLLETQFETNNQIKSRQLTKLTKTSETARKIDLAQDVTFDNNKNYTKNINRMINGTKVSKKLNTNDNNEIINLKTLKNQIKNGLSGRNKKLKNTTIENKQLCNNEISQTSSTIDSNLISTKTSLIINENNNDDNDDSAMINIAERIKQRTKNTIENKKLNSPRKTRSKTMNNNHNNNNNIEDIKSKNKLKLQNLPVKLTDELLISNNEKNIIRKTRNSTRKKINYHNNNNDDNNNDYKDNKNHDNIDNNINNFVVCNDEKSKTEKLLLQEQEDFKLAQRLQEKLNSGGPRTRGSKRALQSNDIELDLKKIKINGKSLSTDNVKYRRKQKKTTT